MWNQFVVLSLTIAPEWIFISYLDLSLTCWAVVSKNMESCVYHETSHRGDQSLTTF